MDNPGKPGYKYEIIHPVTKKPCTMPFWGWRFPDDKLNQLLAEDRIIFGKDEKKIPELKVYLREVEFPLRSVIEMDSRKGSNDLDTLFDTRDVFKNPKPVELMETLLGYTHPTRTAWFLTLLREAEPPARPCMKLNAKDGGQRRFILIEEGEGTGQILPDCHRKAA